MSSTTKTPKYQNKIERLNATKLAESIINKNSYLTAAANNSSTNSTSPHKKTSNSKGSWTKYISENSETQAKENFKNTQDIEMLKKERRFIPIQAYENKIGEQDEQIKYLQEENRELKYLINHMRSSNECQYCKHKQHQTYKNHSMKLIDFDYEETDSNIQCQLLKQKKSTINDNNLKSISIICECESTNSESLHRNYNAFLDNLIQQLISALKIKDLIKLEIFNSSNSSSSNINNIGDTDKNLIKSKNNYFICKSCKKIKIIENNTAIIQDTPAIVASYLLDSNINSNCILINSKFEKNQALVNFKDLIIKQKEQQLNILNELSKMLKAPGKHNKESVAATASSSSTATTTTTASTTGNVELKSSSSLISLKTSSSFSKFNFSKVFHSLSSIELKQTKKSDSKSIFSSTTYTSLSNQNIFVSNNDSNNLHSEEDNYSNKKNRSSTSNISININNNEFFSNINSCLKFVNNESSNTDGLSSYSKISTSSLSLIQSKPNSYFTADTNKSKASREALYQSLVNQHRPSQIPRLDKTYKFQNSSNQNERNFKTLSKLSKIPVRSVVSIEKRSTSSIGISPADKKQPVIKKVINQGTQVISIKKKTSNKSTSNKPINIKFKKTIKIEKRSFTPPTKECRIPTKKVYSKQILRTQTFEKLKEPALETSIQINNNTEENIIDKNTQVPIMNNLLTDEKINFIKKPKRYCFPTYKSLSVYYNDRLNKKHNFKLSSNKNLDCYMPVKYLSDSDVASLADRLSTYDKDVYYNVYHLDTLYSNIDYILFNSYASDTELVYNNCSKPSHGNEPNCSDSSYKLFINDYFNHKYDDCEDDFNTEDDCDEIIIGENQHAINKSETHLLNDYDNKIDNVDISLNDFTFELVNYEMNNSVGDDDNAEFNKYGNNEEFFENECVDSYFLNDDLLFDDDILKISILNELSNTVELKQIKIELNHKHDSFEKKLFMDYINSPTYSLSSFTSNTGSNFSMPKSIADSSSIIYSSILYQKNPSNHVLIIPRSKINNISQSQSTDSLNSQEYNYMFQRQSISTPALSNSNQINVIKNSASIAPLFKPSYLREDQCESSNSNEENKCNNFNTDFYKLCSESYINGGSDFNFNSSASISSFSYKKLVALDINKQATDKLIQNSFTFPIKRVHVNNE